MLTFDRQKKNTLGTWWWTIDRFSMLAILLIIAFGAMMVTAASPAVAERIGLDSFYFVRRQSVFLAFSIGIIFIFSLFSPLTIRRIAVVGFGGGLIFLMFVLLFGQEVKGATRWIYIFGFSLQPSEFIKPFFIVVTAWMLSEAKTRKHFHGFKISVFLYVLLISLIILQPDFGMVVVISSVWAGQLFLAGLPLVWIVAIVIFGVVGILSAYTFLPHVAFRIDSFLNSMSEGGNYQVRKSLEAFSHGGIAGTGPGEGKVKLYLPDSHTDFIFAVAGEELGVLVCLIIVGLYAFVVIRGFKRMFEETDLFVVFAVSGLLMQFGIQALINMGVALNLLPTKGMTLPFISYGGSSMLALSIAIGMMLSLTRRRFGVMFNKPKITA